MTGKTHMAVGVGAAMMLIPTNDVQTLTIGATFAVLGSLVPDLDTESSEVSRKLKDGLMGAVVIAVLLSAAYYKFNLDIRSYLGRFLPESPAVYGIAIAILMGAVVVSKFTPHRTFTHSILGVITFGWPVYLMISSYASWFIIGYAAHILADVITTNGVAMFYPIKKKVKLGLCKTGSPMEHFIALAAAAVIIFKLFVN